MKRSLLYRDREWLEQKFVNEGLTVKQIAELCNVPSGTVKEWVMKYRLRPKREKKEMELLHELYIRKNLSIAEIERITGWSEGSIRYKLRKYGLSGRKRRENTASRPQFIVEDKMECTMTEDDLWKAVMEKQKLIEKLEQRQTSASIRVLSDSEYIALVLFADLHVGSAYTDYRQLREDIELVAETPSCYALLLGDLMDNFVIREMDGKWDDILSPRLQRELCRFVVEKLRPKLLAVLAGDHETFSDWVADYDFIEEIVRGLEGVYMGFGGLLRLQVGEVEYRVAIAHRYRFNSSFNLTHTVKRMLEREWDADIGVVAHGHVADIEEAVMRGQYRILVRTGTYKLYDSYLARKGYWEVKEVRVPVILLNSREKEMIPFLDLRKGLKVLEALNSTGG